MKPIFEKINKLEDQSFYLEKVKRPYFIDLWHFHPEIEILYVSEGFGTRYVGDSISSFYPDDLVIIGSNTPHVWSSNPEYLNPGNKRYSGAICIQFLEDFLGNATSGIPEFLLMNEFLNNARRGIQFVGKTHKKLVRLIKDLPVKIGMERLIGLLTILDIMSTSNDIKYLSSHNYTPGIINSEDKYKMEIIFRYVIKKFPEKILLEEIAALVNLTPQSFCRYFKSRTTKVFSSFVNEVRIGNACRMLIENKHTISQFCYLSGFNYQSNFNRHFKAIKGMTPSEFQLKYKNHNFELMFES
ncbi:MAG: AraC family transcriptional regulator [Bacteroidales bacterium]|nr:AraC family transcriptional regulator [Bacteroidales bacterium]